MSCDFLKHRVLLQLAVAWAGGTYLSWAGLPRALPPRTGTLYSAIQTGTSLRVKGGTTSNHVGQHA